MSQSQKYAQEDLDISAQYLRALQAADSPRLSKDEANRLIEMAKTQFNMSKLECFQKRQAVAEQELNALKQEYAKHLADVKGREENVPAKQEEPSGLVTKQIDDSDIGC